MFEGQRGNRSVLLDQVHCAPVGDPRHRQLRDLLQAGSPLEGHIAELNSIPMMRLVAADVMSLATQLQEIEAAHGSRARKHAAAPDF